MRNNPDRRKTIQGLKACTTMDDKGFPSCEACPYNAVDGTCPSLHDMLADALALIEADQVMEDDGK